MSESEHEYAELHAHTNFSLLDGTTVEASTGGVACIPDAVDTGHRVQVTAVLPDQEINGIIVRVPITVESDATAKYED